MSKHTIATYNGRLKNSFSFNQLFYSKWISDKNDQKEIAEKMLSNLKKSNVLESYLKNKIVAKDHQAIDAFEINDFLRFKSKNEIRRHITMVTIK